MPIRKNGAGLVKKSASDWTSSRGVFFRRLLVRPKYVLIGDKEAAPVIAPLPECLQERGIAAPGLLATVAVPNTATTFRSTGRR